MNERRFFLNPRQQLAWDCPYFELLFGGAKGGSKAATLDTPIPTPGGWSTFGAIRAGDLVLAEDGRPSRVLGATDVVRHRCYRLTFSDGSSIVVD